MGSGFLDALKDAKTLQEGINAFDTDADALAQECPDTELVFREIEDPDVEELDEEEDADNDSEANPTYIIVRDYSTDLPIPNAVVTFNRKNYYANAEGKVFLGNIREGTSHDVKVTASGYTDTEDDNLDNDILTVPLADFPPPAGGSVG